MKQCNYCANKKCTRPSKNTFPKFKFKPGNKWDRGDTSCKHYQPIVSTIKFEQHFKIKSVGA